MNHSECKDERLRRLCAGLCHDCRSFRAELSRAFQVPLKLAAARRADLAGRDGRNPHLFHLRAHVEANCKGLPLLQGHMEHL